MHVKSVYTSVDFAHATSVSCNRIARRAFTQCSRAVYNGTARRWFKRFEFGRVRVTVSVSHNWYTYDNISLNRARGVMSQQCKTLPRRYTSSISFDVHINNYVVRLRAAFGRRRRRRRNGTRTRIRRRNLCGLKYRRVRLFPKTTNRMRPGPPERTQKKKKKRQSVLGNI